MSQDPNHLPSPGAENPLLNEAITWCLRMNGEDADRYQAAFDEWIALGGVHRQIYSEVSELYGFGETLRELPLKRPVMDDGGKSCPRKVHRRRKPALAATIFLAATMGVFFMGTNGHHDRLVGELGEYAASARQARTALGEIRKFQLSNKMRMTLDTDTLVTMPAPGQSRPIRLERGRVRFEVASAEQPFTVLAGPAIISGRGAVFDVSVMGEEGFDVSLVRGAVEIREFNDGQISRKWTPRRLSTGYLARYRQGGGLVIQLQVQDQDAAREWPSGVMAFDGVPLSQVIRLANRYAITKIYLSDPNAANRPFHGTLRMRDTHGVARILAHAYGLKISEDAGIIRLFPQ